MSPLTMFAAIVTLGTPTSDRDLAAATSTAPSPVAITRIDPIGPPPVAEIIDHWWATTGLAMIAANLRPVPPVPLRLNLDAARDGHVAIRFATTLTATTRP